MHKLKTLAITLLVTMTLAASSAEAARRGRASCCKMKHCCYQSMACCKKGDHACCTGKHVKGGCCCKKGSCPMPAQPPGTGQGEATITGNGF
jgi:hypothetical protein